MKRVIIVGLVGLLLAASLLAFTLFPRRPATASQPTTPETSVEIVLGEPLIKPYGQVSVAINGVEVYRDEMRTMTLYGVQWLMNLLFYWQTAQSAYGISVPFRVRLSYTSGGTTTTIDASAGKSWGWNSTHMWFTVTGSYLASADWTLRWVALIWQDPSAMRTFTNDTLSNIVIPANSDFAITLWFYWRDNGILHENWARTLDGILVHQIPYTTSIIDVGGTSRSFGVAGTGAHYYVSSWVYDGRPAGTLRVTMALGTNCDASWWSRTSTTARLGNQVVTITPSISIGSRGVVVSGTINREGICEVALRFTANIPTTGTTPVGTYDYIILRWVSPQPLPVGTTVRIYLIPPPP